MTAETACPHCGTRLHLGDSVQGAEVRCPACGRLFSAPIEVVDYEVIEVRAEPVETAPQWSEAEPRHTPHPNIPPNVFVWQRNYAGGNGCCGCGCLSLIALALLVGWAITQLLSELL